MVKYIPNDILNKIPDYFGAAFCGELASVFSLDIFETNDTNDMILIRYREGTAGWNAALKMACRKLDMDWFYDWYNNLNWWMSDLVDEELTDIFVMPFVEDWNREGISPYYKWLIEKDNKVRRDDV